MNIYFFRRVQHTFKGFSNVFEVDRRWSRGLNALLKDAGCGQHSPFVSLVSGIFAFLCVIAWVETIDAEAPTSAILRMDCWDFSPPGAI